MAPLCEVSRQSIYLECLECLDNRKLAGGFLADTSYLIANLRLVLGVDVTPGTESNSPYSLLGLLEILDDLPAAMRPFLVRADRGYGNDAVMSALEKRGQDYLLKLPMNLSSG